MPTCCSQKKIVSFYENYAAIDGLRIIFCLREPVSREISFYKNQKRDYIQQGTPLSEGGGSQVSVNFG